MCDYSLAEFPSRLAEEGNILVVHRFPSGTKGLISEPTGSGLRSRNAASWDV